MRQIDMWFIEVKAEASAAVVSEGGRFIPDAYGQKCIFPQGTQEGHTEAYMRGIDGAAFTSSGPWTLPSGKVLDWRFDASHQYRVLFVRE